MCLCSISRRSRHEIKDHMSSADLNCVVFDQAEQTCVCAELADTFEFLILSEMLPKHTILYVCTVKLFYSFHEQEVDESAHFLLVKNLFYTSVYTDKPLLCHVQHWLVLSWY